MTRFELVKKVLDSLWATVESNNDDERVQLIRTAQQSLSQKYRDLRTVKEIDYSDPSTQLAYIYTYTAAHSDILYQVANRIDRRCKFKRTGKFKLTSFGGGPGSDMLGFMKFFEKSDAKDLELIHNSCDKDDDWSFCWSSVLEQSCSEENKTFSKINATFHKVDITDYEKRKRIDQFMQSDVFTFLYFISEIIAKKDEAEDFFKYIFNNIASGSIVVFIDNNMEDVVSYFKSFLEDKYEIIIDESDDMRLSISEEKTALEEYRMKFGSHPRLTAKVHICVVRKI